MKNGMVRFIQYLFGVAAIGGTTAMIAHSAGVSTELCFLAGVLMPLGVNFMAASLDTTKP